MPSITENLVASIESELEVLKSLPKAVKPEPEPEPEPAPVVEVAPAPVVTAPVEELAPWRKLVLDQAAERLARETAN